MWASTHPQGAQAPSGLSEHAANGSAADGSAATGTATIGLTDALHGAAGGVAVSRELLIQPASGRGRSEVTDNGSTVATLPSSSAAAFGSLPEATTYASSEASCQALPKVPLVLPAPECLRPELNGVDRDLQNTLRCPSRLTWSRGLCCRCCSVGHRTAKWRHTISWDLDHKAAERSGLHPGY